MDLTKFKVLINNLKLWVFVLPNTKFTWKKFCIFFNKDFILDTAKLNDYVTTQSGEGSGRISQQDYTIVADFL